MKNNKIYLGWMLIVILLASCENRDNSFPDFDYQTVYFPNTYYVRTIELGDDMYVDTSLDNQHKINIKATMGGIYENTVNRIIEFEVDESLLDNLYFANNTPIIPMPANYYKLASTDRMIIPAGKIQGGVEIELTDAFFEDPKSLVNTYAIPLVLIDVQNADSILRGRPSVENPDRCIASDWISQPMDFVICVVKYVNPWHADYLRRGVDNITKNGVAEVVARREQYVEKDEISSLKTTSYRGVEYPLTYTNIASLNLPVSLSMDFNENNECTITPATTSVQVNDSIRVYNITAQGSGKFIKEGEKESMGGLDRDALYLDYEVSFEAETTYPGIPGRAPFYETHTYHTKDTLVVRNRGIVPEYFSVKRQ